MTRVNTAAFITVTSFSVGSVASIVKAVSVASGTAAVAYGVLGIASAAVAAGGISACVHTDDESLATYFGKTASHSAAIMSTSFFLLAVTVVKKSIENFAKAIGQRVFGVASGK